MSCKSCQYYKYESNLSNYLGCQLWSDFKLNIKRLPIDTRCPGCGGYQPVTPNEFMIEINKTGPKHYVIADVLIGNINRHSGVVVSENDHCMFYKEK